MYYMHSLHWGEIYVVSINRQYICEILFQHEGESTREGESCRNRKYCEKSSLSSSPEYAPLVEGGGGKITSTIYINYSLSQFV